MGGQGSSSYQGERAGNSRVAPGDEADLFRLDEHSPKLKPQSSFCSANNLNQAVVTTIDKQRAKKYQEIKPNLIPVTVCMFIFFVKMRHSSIAFLVPFIFIIKPWKIAVIWRNGGEGVSG